jgi:curved DNA-binding protein CbpA
MTFYEELGISDRASAEEIKDAYRSLMRLLHPDHVQDPELRRVADIQVKKLNRVYEILSDPERRRRYDLEQQEGERRAAPIIFHAPPPPARKKLVTRSSALWVGAVSAFAVLLIWMASRQTPTGPDYSSGASLAEPEPQPARPSAAVVLPQRTSPVTSSADVEAGQLRERLARTINERDAALAEVSRLRSQQPEVAGEKPKPKREVAFTPPPEIQHQPAHIAEPVLPAPPLMAQQPTQQPTQQPSPQPQRNPMVGQWVYRPSDSPSRNKELYPPEFIETSISEDNGEVRGTYRARYHVVDRPVSPEVNFQFAGKLTGDSGSLPWNGSGGSRGEVTFRIMADHSLKVDWVASQLGQLGFYKGTAVLVKRSE